MLECVWVFTSLENWNTHTQIDCNSGELFNVYTIAIHGDIVKSVCNKIRMFIQFLGNQMGSMAVCLREEQEKREENRDSKRFYIDMLICW